MDASGCSTVGSLSVHKTGLLSDREGLLGDIAGLTDDEAALLGDDAGAVFRDDMTFVSEVATA